MMSNSATRTLTATVDAAINRLAIKERGGSHLTVPQWLFWAMHDQHTHLFDKLIDVVNESRKRPLTAEEAGLIKDGLAIGRTNVTPERVQWTFKWAPPAARARALTLFSPDAPVESVERAVIAATPFDPSSDKWYEELWRRFNGKLAQHLEAYKWLGGAK